MRKHSKAIPEVMALIAVLLAAPATMASRHPAAKRGPQRIEREVRHELVMLPFYGVFLVTNNWRVEKG